MRWIWKPDWADWVPKSTVEALRESYMPVMPPLAEGGYLVGYLLELGPVVAAGAGTGPITFEEIDRWCSRMGIDLSPWETRTLRKLSLEYLSESHRAEKRGCEPPWIAPEINTEK